MTTSADNAPTWQQLDEGLPLFKTLASSLQLGGIGNVRNRIAMASMTRTRGLTEHPDTGYPDVASDLTVEYYRQRAKGGCGLILTEGSMVSMQGSEYPSVPSIYTQPHADAWRKVVDAVHQEGALIVCQLWHVGRVAHPDMPLQKKAGKPVSAPSAVKAFGGNFRTLNNASYVEAPAHPDPWELVDEYRQAAKYAKSAGFDGIELHGAAGYLPQQFLDSGSNVRTDQWGGSTENRARFIIECLKAMKEHYPADKIGLKLNPCGGLNDIGMSEAETRKTYTYVIEEAVKLGLSYIQLVKYLPFMDFEIEPGKLRATQLDVLDIFGPIVKKSGHTKLLFNGDLNAKDAESLLAADKIDVAVFGRVWINNPDFADRALKGLPMNDDMGFPLRFMNCYVWEKEPSEGYTDYPSHDQALKSKTNSLAN